MLRSSDEDRWIAAGYAQRRPRFVLHALYAVHAEIAATPHRVSEPQLGEMRLQWWRETLREVEGDGRRGHPALEAAKIVGLSGDEIDAFDGMIDARAQLLYSEPFATLADLEDWLRRAEAPLAWLAARRLASIEAFAQPAIIDAAAAYGLARYAPADLRREAAARAQELLRPASATVARLHHDLMPAFAHMSLTGMYANGRAPNPVAKRIRIFQSVLTGRL